MSAQSLLDHARYYVSKGISVIPLKHKDKKPALSSWKEYQERLPKDEELIKWFGNGANLNIGAVTGRISGIVAVDLDTAEAVDYAKQNNFPISPLSKTGKGYHIVYRYKDGVRNFQKRDDLPGIDLRGDGGYIAVAPSVHPSGHVYHWVEGKGLDDLALAELPEIILASKSEGKTPLKDLYKGTDKGNRNDALARLAGSWVNDGLTVIEMLEQARAVNLNNTPPLSEKEIEQTIQSIFDKHHREQKQDAAPVREINIVSIHDFLAMDIPQREVVLSPWLPAQGICMVYGYRGSGKTYILLGVAVAISSGGAFLRFHAENPRRVVYIDGEMPAKVMQERLSSVIASADKEPLPGHLQIITSDFQKNGLPDLSTPEGQSMMDAYFEKGDVVILDNISTLCRTGKENTGDDWGPVQAWALSLRRKDISIIFVHHEGKNGLQRGTSKREDVLDTVIRLKRPGDYSPAEGLRVEVHFEKNRGIYGDDVKPFEVKLTADDSHLDWQIKDLEESLTERVAGLLNEGIPQNELAEMLQVSKGTVSKHKKRAQDQGLLKGGRS